MSHLIYWTTSFSFSFLTHKSHFISPNPQMASSSRHSPQFTPILEEREFDDLSGHDIISHSRSSHPPTPIVHKHTKSNHNNHKKKRSDSEEDGSVSCNKCRPHSRDKIFILPLDHSSTNNSHKPSSLLASPNGIFRSLVSKLTRKSPMSSSSSQDPLPPSREEQWKMAVAELSHKLLHATRKRDEALLEASRLMHSMSELEKKLNKLELYCHTLKSGLEQCTNNNITTSPTSLFKSQTLEQDTVIQHFLVSVSEARSSVRLLSRSLTMQLRHMGSKVYEKVSFLLQPYDIKISFSKSPTRSLLFYLEALLNRTFYEDFETIGFQKNACNMILNPKERCEASYESFNMVHGLTWEEVLSKGTRHFSEEFSRFCDRKMSEIVAMLGWNRAWPEALLQAFFGASKSVWKVHLLANSLHPSLPIFRVEKGVRFDSVYMEDMGGGDKATSNLVPALVRIMLAPGFYVYGSAVKCKVLCRYLSTSSNKEDKPLTPTPS
ncbi:IRK-interacting protein-like [Glycine soja]|uniref:IRK-interacting protein isoform A n=2 Tax=Glycine soja TaxID=3848 RepID=A0A445JAB7_GLYSO|nr:IRK-interacting protein-like [Glycine soja]RZB95331.1 IRK-interacting protein isoform A [Glycine soja]